MQAIELPSNHFRHGLPIAHVYGVNDGRRYRVSRRSRVESVFETRSVRLGGRSPSPFDMVMGCPCEKVTTTEERWTEHMET